jgi:hypothetical protein
MGFLRFCDNFHRSGGQQSPSANAYTRSYFKAQIPGSKTCITAKTLFFPFLEIDRARAIR